MCDWKELQRKIVSGDKIEWEDVHELMPYQWGNVVKATHGCLNSAALIHDALVPGYWSNLAPDYCHAFPSTNNAEQKATTGHSTKPSRAWLLAILRTLEQNAVSDIGLEQKTNTNGR